MKSRNYIPKEAIVTKRSELAENTVTFKLELKDGKPFNFIPGQFIMLSTLGFGEIPVGIASSPDEKKTIEVVVRNVGLVSKKITECEVGATLGISGPFGNGLPPEKLKDKNVVILAGGLGFPPLRSYIKYLEKHPKKFRSLTILYGAKTPNDLLFREEYKNWTKFAKVLLTVDHAVPNWDGSVGIITKLFDQIQIKPGSVMLVCGPPVMFKTVIDRYAGKSVAEADLYFFLERKMQCGIGKCQHCTCGEKYVCLDGPIFTYANLKYNLEAFA